MNPSGAGRGFGQKLGQLLADEIHRVVQACLYGTDFNFIPKGKLAALNRKLCQHDGLIVDSEGPPYAIIESKIIQKAKQATEQASKPAREHPDKELGKQILAPVAKQLEKVVEAAIADIPENPVVGVVVDILRQRGEILHHQFDGIEGALDYLQSWRE